MFQQHTLNKKQEHSHKQRSSFVLQKNTRQSNYDLQETEYKNVVECCI